jgi:hypothetical protein
MFTPNDVKRYLDRVIEDLDGVKKPRKPSIPWWVKAVAGPAALGVTVGLAGCGDPDPEDEAISKDEAAQSKADGFTDELCAYLFAEPGCDLCAEMGWYGDGICDTFCETADPDCTDIVPLYGVPVLECDEDADCPEGSQCVTTTIGECPEGAWCILPPSTTGTCEAVLECLIDADCGLGNVCVDGECAVEVVPLYGVPIVECEGDADCPDGSRCVTSEVGECPEGAYCILPPSTLGTCEPVIECDEDADCAEGQECLLDDGCPEGAYCILPPSGTGICVDTGGEIVPLYGVPVLECDEDTDCPDGSQCVTPDVGDCPEGAYCILPPSTMGTCEVVEACVNDSDCDDGMVCNDGACEYGMVPLYGVPVLECNADSDCPDGTRCVSPDVGECPEGAYCILPPGGMGTCEPVVECDEDSDCPEGTECLVVGECPEDAYCILPPGAPGTCIST